MKLARMVSLLKLNAWKKMNNLMIEVQAGEGGSDSKLFVEDLFGAYL